MRKNCLPMLARESILCVCDFGIVADLEFLAIVAYTPRVVSSNALDAVSGSAVLVAMLPLPT